MTALIFIVALLSFFAESSTAWMTATPARRRTVVTQQSRLLLKHQRIPLSSDTTSSMPLSIFQQSSRRTTELSMYNLPPGKNDNGLSRVLSSVLGFVLFAAFIFSPIGGFFLSILNGFLALSILLPFGAAAAFQVWQYFNTVSGPCPNCGAPVRVLKRQSTSTGVVEDIITSPSICYNCGTLLSTLDNENIVDVSGRNSLDDLERGGFGSLFDLLAGGGSGPVQSSSTRTTVTKTTRRTKGGKEIIDVEVTRDD
jgi:hypothetical protein